MHAVVRHSIYATKLLIVDPFLYPLSVRDEYSPILHPEQHRAQTLRNANIWLALAPWIDAGLVEVIRTPADFDPKLAWDSIHSQRKKFAENTELAAAATVSVEEMKQRHGEDWKFRHLVLSSPDASLLHDLDAVAKKESGISKEDLLSYIQKKRDEDPDFLEPFSATETSAQLFSITSGASYDIARLTASLTGSYLITDLTSKWREIEIDRQGRSAETTTWSPFAQAIQHTSFRYLESVSIQDALNLRKQERLESFRAFLRRVWTQACAPESFDKVNARLLADELEGEVKKANEEWAEIDRELLKYAGAAAAGIAAASPIIGTGQGEFIAAAALLAGLPALASSTWKRKGFADRFPAAFFLKLAENR